MIDREKIALLIAAIILFWLVILLIIPSNPLERPPGPDNGVFLYGGQQVLSGKTPYVDFWDHKGPLIYSINALGLLIMKGSRWGVWFIEFIFLILTAGGLYWIGRRLWGIPISLLSVGIWAYGIFRLGTYHNFHDSNSVESYSLLFGVTAACLWLAVPESAGVRKYFLGIGLMAGLAFMLRPNLVGIPASIVIVETIMSLRKKMLRRGVERVGFIALGAVFVLVCFAVWFLLNGALPDAFDALITYNLIYSQKEWAFNTFELFIMMAAQVDWLPVIGYILVMVAFILRLGFIKPEPRPSDQIFMGFLLVGWPLEIILASLSGRSFLHYFITWTPYMGWLIGAALGSGVLPFTKRLINAPAYPGFGLAIACLFIIGLPLRGSVEELLPRVIYQRDRGLEAESAVVRYVEDHTEPGEKVLVWGNEVWINFLADRESPSKYIYQYPLFMPGYTDRAKIIGFLEELMEAPPTLIIEPLVDTNAMLPITPSRRGSVSKWLYVPGEISQVFEYIDSNYCVSATLNDIIIRRYSGSRGTSCPESSQ